LKNIFINKNSQLRSGWKIVSTFSSFYLGTIVLTIILLIIYILTKVMTGSIGENGFIIFINNISGMASNLSTSIGFIVALLQCLTMIFFVVLFWKVYDRKPIREIGMINIKKGYKDLIKGLVFGAVSLILVFIILLYTEQITLINPFSKPNFSYALLTGLIIFIFVGINEEMFARGYCMTVLKQTGNKYVVVIVSAIIFALMHSLNPSVTLLSYLNLFLFGLLTAYMFIKSGNLWLPIGYHIAWNYFEGNVFGFLVSGQGAAGIYNLNVPVYNIINGGEFGPEGGIVVTFIVLAGLIYIWKFYKPTYQ